MVCVWYNQDGKNDGEGGAGLGKYELLGDSLKDLKGDALFTDLNLEPLFDEIFKDKKGYCYQMPSDLQTVKYRQEMMRALDDRMLEDALRRFVLEIGKAREYEENALSLERGDGYANWHLKAAYTYYKALDGCISFLEEREFNAEGIQDFLLSCRQIMEGLDHCKNHDRAVHTYERLAGIRYSMRIERDHVRILPQIIKEDAVGGLRQQFPLQIGMPEQMPRLLPGNEKGTKIEEKIFKYLEKKDPGPFKEMRVFANECREIFSQTVLQFCDEISFYLSFVTFQRQMESCGHVFCYPEFNESGMEVAGGYDLALAYKNEGEGKKTVPNDYHFSGKERFFVVTGPNQGGKTTFGRAAGQLVYFANMGFPVPAKRAKLPWFSGIVTHFSVEESMESGRGKLKEELVRLAPLMHGRQRRVFVIINELFTTAATYDATQMGKYVMEHFLEQECYGIYVTHIDELAKENEQTVSLVASIKDEKEHIRTYKIVRQPAQGKGYVETIVDQFGLSYEEIVRRLGHV